MTGFFQRWGRWTAPLVLAVGLTFSPMMTTTVRAQDEGVPGEKAEGRPLDGYLATICLVLFALFVVGKSARR